MSGADGIDAATGAAGGALAVPLAEVRDWLALAPGAEDASLAGLVRCATEVAEGFTGLTLVARRIVERVRVPDDGGWATLARRPVRAIVGVRVDGAGDGSGDESQDGREAAVVDPAAYAIDIGIDGTGRVRRATGGGLSLVAGGGPAGGPQLGQVWRVAYDAGLVGDPGRLPAALRHGILRLVEHLRLGSDAPGAGRGGGALVPSAVAALWLPYRRVRLG